MMFSKTLLRLTALNALVLLTILCGISVTTYLYTKHQIIGSIDEALHKEISGRQEAVMPRGLRRLFVQMLAQRAQRLDSRVTILLWDGQGKLLNTPRNQESISNEMIERLYTAKAEGNPKTVVIHNKTFRILTYSSGADLAEVRKARGVNISLIQAIYNIDSEIGMLQSLRLVIFACILAGGLFAVAAGYYLARRAIVPIIGAWEQQQRFVADASHELRTPLSIVKSNTELLLRHPDHSIEEESRRISTILKETNRLTKLVSDLLVLARADTNQTNLIISPVHLEQILGHTAEAFKPLFDIKTIQFDLRLEKSIEVTGDVERLEQLFIILLDNALRYTPEGGAVNVICRRSGSVIHVTVEDTGIGIAEQDLPFIFDRFYRGDKARSRSNGGAGLGLSIAKWIVEKHGGSIRVESRIAEGTRANVVLPLPRN